MSSRPPKPLPFPARTIGLYGDTDSGKSTQGALLAKHVFQASGGKLDADGKAVGGLRTRIYLVDTGSPEPYRILVELGIATIEDIRDVPHPYLAAEKIAQGMTHAFTGRTENVNIGGTVVPMPEGAWKPSDLSQIGLIILDSGTMFADKMFFDLSEKAAYGVNIGGEGAMNFSDGSKSYGDFIVGSSNKAHYGVVQNRMQDLITGLSPFAEREQVIVLMTFAVDRGEQESAKKAVAGPKLVGGAKTAVAPGWMGLCFNLVKVQNGATVDHCLHTASRVEGGVEWMANRRIPLLEPGDPYYATIKTKFIPANLVEALTVHKAASEEVRRRVIASMS